MNENEIKAVAWRCIWSKSGKPAWEQYHDESDPMPEQWDVRPNEVRPLYDQSAIDRLIAQARGLRAIANEAAGMLEDAEDRIVRLTAERAALLEHLDWTVRENDRLLDEGRELAAELASLRSAPEAEVLRVAMNTLEQIATTSRNKGARMNAKATLLFLHTQLAARAQEGQG